MKEITLPIHEHPLLPVTRFTYDECRGCWVYNNIYAGYRCNELGCGSVFHRECAESLPEINHSSHPHHPLKLLQRADHSFRLLKCDKCGKRLENGYICSICDFKLDLRCVKAPALVLENSNLHQHPLELVSSRSRSNCKVCDSPVLKNDQCYRCHPCEFVFHTDCAKFFPEANHTFHPQHPLKFLRLQAAPDYVDKKCLLCKEAFNIVYHPYHCDVCNISICLECMKNPPPVSFESPTTHEHELHLVPRRIDFTCNACGTLGDRSPYFCLQCNFMIHRDCIDLPRVININRHDHRISYTRRLGLGEEWKCKVCRKKVDGFYGAYTCFRCPTFAVHSLCATRKDVWDMIELEGMPVEEEEIAPFEVINDNTIKHFFHDHNLLRINKDGHDQIQPENIVCEACRLQILSEPFYKCKQCNFFLHDKCANYPRKKRHVMHNQPFTLFKDSLREVDKCWLCEKYFTGFRYDYSDYVIMDVRCAAISDTLEHGSHPHPLYFDSTTYNRCSGCGKKSWNVFSCDECDYTLDGKCAHFPEKVMRNRYDDHPFFLSFGIENVEGDYWCEACETKVNPKKWFYTCNECGTILHISCVVGDFSYITPGTHLSSSNEKVESNISICRPLCSGPCNSRCKLPSIRKISEDGVDRYFCSFEYDHCSNETLK